MLVSKLTSFANPATFERKHTIVHVIIWKERSEKNVGAVVGSDGLGTAAIASSNPARGISVDISMPSSLHTNILYRPPPPKKKTYISG
jgi:hypothetical protein